MANLDLKKIEEYKEFFREITDKEPYDFQMRIANILLNTDKNIILVAPTGSGKSWAVHLPFIFSKSVNTNYTIEDKMFHVLPIRTLTHGLFVDTKQLLNNASIKKNGWKI